MSDHVDYLRDTARHVTMESDTLALNAAADEIERLRAALKEIANLRVVRSPWWTCQAQVIAREALK